MKLPPKLEAFKIAFKSLENLGYLEYHSQKVIMHRLKNATQNVNSSIFKTNNPNLIANAILYKFAEQTIHNIFLFIIFSYSIKLKS